MTITQIVGEEVGYHLYELLSQLRRRAWVRQAKWRARQKRRLTALY